MNFKIELKEGVSKKTGQPYAMLVTTVNINGKDYLVPLDSKERFLINEIKRQLRDFND